jgi:ribonuclease P protein component
VGKAVIRNRIKRRMRESVRLELDKLPPRWDIIFNPRRSVLEAPFAVLRLEVEKVFARCATS